MFPDTFYTAPPDWTWWIIPYFFVGGIAGGALFLGALLHLLGRPGDRPVVRMAYYVALVGAAISGPLLILDLHRPERFLHMLIESETWQPMFKLYSPMSIGSWGLIVFSGFAFLLVLGALHERGTLRWSLLRRLSTGPVATVLAIGGAMSGLFLAGYTGVLLSVSNRPVWADSNWLGMLFLFSGGSTAAATLMLLAIWRRVSHGTVEYLSSFDKATLVLELIVLVIFLVSIGAAIQVFLSWWGVLLVLGVVITGILLPLAISQGMLVRVASKHVVAASLVLVGGLLLRAVVLLSSHTVHMEGAQVLVP